MSAQRRSTDPHNGMEKIAANAALRLVHMLLTIIIVPMIGYAYIDMKRTIDENTSALNALALTVASQSATQAARVDEHERRIARLENYYPSSRRAP